MKKNNSPVASSGANIFAQNPPVEGRQKRDASRLSEKSKQVNLWKSPQSPVPEAGLFRQKPQIVSISGISLKELHRYQVVLRGEVLGDRLTLDEAIALANQSTHL
jgi:hypothetical protein